MAHYDIFREQLGIKYPAYGHALWEPSPGTLYSYVEVGDVGYVREGKFHRLFNALLPGDHPSHSTFGVPEYHEPLTPYPSRHIDTLTRSSDSYCSQGIVVDTELENFARRYSQRPVFVVFVVTDTLPGQMTLDKSHICAKRRNMVQYYTFRYMLDAKTPLRGDIFANG
jgi:hypothetical protein